VDLETHYTKEYLDEKVESCTRRAILYKVNAIYLHGIFITLPASFIVCIRQFFWIIFVAYQVIMLFAGGCPVKEVIQEFC